VATAQDYSIVPLDETAPVDELPAEIAQQLSSTGFVVKRGEKTSLCSIWLCKSWSAKADFKPTAELLYPFTPGELLGVVQYARRGGDFRDQQIDRGLYTLRYAQQPVDGNHVGTSPTRDFVLLIKVADDQSPAPIDVKKLYEESAKAAESTHPCLLLMPRIEGEATDKAVLTTNEEKDWVIVRLPGKTTVDAQEKLQSIEIVVVGHADE
jgi:hypothetical protein